MASDGTPWRPFVHILDISQAVACVLTPPDDVVHNEIVQRRRQRAELPGPGDRRGRRKDVPRGAS